MKWDIIIYISLLVILSVTTLIAFFRQGFLNDVMSTPLNTGSLKGHTMHVLDMLVDGKGVEEQRLYLKRLGINDRDCDEILSQAEEKFSQIIQNSDQSSIRDSEAN